MAKHELRGLFQGSMLGILWLVLRPLIQAGAYIVLVGFVFQVKLGTVGSRFDYALYVLTGLVAWEYMSKALAETPMLIRSRMAIVSQVVYPIETLPLASLLVGAVGPGLTLLIVLTLGAFNGSLAWTTIFLLVPMILLLTFLIGAGWIFMFVGVLVKDLTEVIGLVLGLMVYFSPVILTETMVGPTIWKLVQLNPLSHVVISMRDVFYGTFHLRSWVIFGAMSLTVFSLGAWTVTHAKVKINEFL
jgi:lipopolysaccharide transport system permease protein